MSVKSSKALSSVFSPFKMVQFNWRDILVAINSKSNGSHDTLPRWLEAELSKL